MNNLIPSRLIHHPKVSSMRFSKLLSILSCVLLTIAVSVQNTTAEEITIDELIEYAEHEFSLIKTDKNGISEKQHLLELRKPLSTDRKGKLEPPSLFYANSFFPVQFLYFVVLR